MGPRFFLRKTIGGHGHRLRVGVGLVPKYCLFLIYANFCKYILKSLSQPHYCLSVTSLRFIAHRPLAWIILRYVWICCIYSKYGQE